MSLTRKLIAETIYQNHRIEARYMGPDLLAYVNDIELANFYVNTQAAFEAGRRHVDYELKAAKEKANGK